jgi:hypothetical protein
MAKAARVLGLAVLVVMLAAPAEAGGRWRGRGGAGGFAGGLIGGLIGGAIVGSAVAASPYYYGPGPYYYGPRPYPYYGGPAYVAADPGGCYWQRQRFWDGYAWRIRRVQVCG